jgi:hypothetical protein
LSAVLLAGTTPVVFAQESEPATPSWHPGEVTVTRYGMTFREGVTPTGNKYSYSANGNGSVSSEVPKASWTASCKIDPITDVQECSAIQTESRLFLWLGGSATVTGTCIFGHDFPGRRGNIRVDTNTAFTTDLEGCLNSPVLLKQLIAGEKVTTRRVEWPNDYNDDHTGDIGPLGEALQLVAYIRRNRQKFSF